MTFNIKIRFILKHPETKATVVIYETLEGLTEGMRDLEFKGLRYQGYKLVSKDLWTGLLDKHGVEAYVGDLLRFGEDHYYHVRFGVFDNRPTSEDHGCGFYLEGLFELANNKTPLLPEGVKEFEIVKGRVIISAVKGKMEIQGRLDDA